ncbi:helix-turn-helix domain-containing protein [Melissospora conviva]|uniref:helix-turn-helix domain-containing protein n=1 Tax=Melissospora conviva TaxID=3388432 RepID=UPI003C206411
MTAGDPPGGIEICRCFGQDGHVLRILLTSTDLVRIRFEVDPGPLVDISHAARALRRPPVALLASWRSAVIRSLDARVHPLLALNPPTGSTCDVVQAPCADLESGLEQLRAASRTSIRSEIDDLAVPATLWLRRLAQGDRAARADLVEATARMHAVAVGPLTADLVAFREADVARRSAELATSGLATVIGALHRTLHLHGETLQVERPFSYTHRSDGLGIVLVPSPFLVDEVRVMFGEGRPVRLFYSTGTPFPSRSSQGDDPLARMLGGTRATVLRALVSSCGTVTLSRRIGSSPATASEHVAVLRGAGLVATARVGRGVRHWLTPLGAQLLSRATPRRPR